MALSKSKREVEEEANVILRQIVYDLSSACGAFSDSDPRVHVAYHRAGPRKQIFFEPKNTRAAIVTCGGLCPGLNTVIRELVVGLWELYGVRQILGIQAGYRGFYSTTRNPLVLNPKMVRGWHKLGGTVLETSRGGFDLHQIVDAIQTNAFNQSLLSQVLVNFLLLCLSVPSSSCLQPMGTLDQITWFSYCFSSSFGLPSVRCDIQTFLQSHFLQVYIIGGDGTMRGAVEIFDEIQRRKINVGVVGIPKTVDNDVGIIDRSFGFQTAVEMAQQAISAAHVEAESAVNGIGLVKLMGRSTGHIALHATLSSRDVDCCLIPEMEFYLEGKGGLVEFLDNRLKENGHAVLVVAEGAGQNMIPRTAAQTEERDESGNLVFLDVGSWLKTELKKWWARDHPGKLFTVKYIDPTYMIRAVPANATDNLYCTLLAHSAIHGVMAGYTGFVSGPINGNYAYIPLEDVAQATNAVNTKDHKWAWVRTVTNQPDFVKS
ncbi:ATP-dependent 6-phosphofructokinase 2 [Citrus sinensis]|nr:ATP-dependent 6-phosphofructokinase 2 [Citrus sinensis]